MKEWTLYVGHYTQCEFHDKKSLKIFSWLLRSMKWKIHPLTRRAYDQHDPYRNDPVGYACAMQSNDKISPCRIFISSNFEYELTFGATLPIGSILVYKKRNRSYNDRIYTILNTRIIYISEHIIWTLNVGINARNCRNMHRHVKNIWSWFMNQLRNRSRITCSLEVEMLERD